MAAIFQGLQFYPGKSIVHRLDPRVKLFLSSALLITTLLYLEVTVTTLIIVIEVALAAVSGTVKRWIRTVYGAIPLIIAVFAMNYLVRAFQYSGFLNPMGLYESFAASYRLIAFLASFSIFFLTTTPEELGMTLTKLRVPYTYTFAFISAIRFTPILAEELQTIMDAQRARGLELDRGGPLARIRKYIPVLVPLIVNILRRSYELAEAMEVKCFGASKKRTFLKELKMTPKDLAVLVIIAVFFGSAIYLRFFYPLRIP
ncbi:MAG: energy-coupling factor transporter transmembrane protein EcfT [Nitrososphaeria archaeon]|nr:energy-coupling factor transporter transmembrane protein EcfT [Nitrososphaeria archaeon]